MDRRRENNGGMRFSPLTGWGSHDTNVWPLGQDAAFARSFADRYDNVAGIVDALSTNRFGSMRGLRPQKQPLGAGLAAGRFERHAISNPSRAHDARERQGCFRARRGEGGRSAISWRWR